MFRLLVWPKFRIYCQVNYIKVISKTKTSIYSLETSIIINIVFYFIASNKIVNCFYALISISILGCWSLFVLFNVKLRENIRNI